MVQSYKSDRAFRVGPGSDLKQAMDRVSDWSFRRNAIAC